MNSTDFNDIPSEISQFADHYERILHTGSKVIQSDTAFQKGYRSPHDDDYIVLCKDQSQADQLMIAVTRDSSGWLVGGSMSAENPGLMNKEHKVLEDGTWSNENLFLSFKYEFPQTDVVNGEITDYKIPLNLLITCNEEYFDDFTRATFLAKALELNKKEDRVTLFEAVTRNKWPTGERKKEEKHNRIKLSPKSLYTFGTSSINYYGLSAAQNLINPPITVNEVAAVDEIIWDNGQAVVDTNNVWAAENQN